MADGEHNGSTDLRPYWIAAAVLAVAGHLAYVCVSRDGGWGAVITWVVMILVVSEANLRCR